MIKITNSGIEATIELFGEIGNSFWSDGWTLERFRNELKTLDAPVLNINAKSMGGDVFEAFAIYDAIRAMKTRVVINIVGTSASAMTVIASAGDKVTISENSRYLVHNAQTFVEGNKESLKEMYDQLVSIDNQILDVYVKRTGKSKNVLADLMKAERWMTAEEALDWGFVDEIIKSEKVITNKIKNIMTEEEILALKTENEALKAQLMEAQAKLAEYETEKEEMMDAEIDAEIETAVTAGKIEATAKDGFKAFGKSNGKESLKAIFNAIKVVELASIPDTQHVPEPMTPAKWMSNFKANVYANKMDVCKADYKTAFGKELIN